MNKDDAKGFVADGVSKIKEINWVEKKRQAKDQVCNAKDRIAKTWRSGVKGKILCVGAALLILKMGSCIFGGGSDSFSRAVDMPFQQMLLSSSSSEIGDAFKHSETPYVRVLSVVDGGVLICYVSGGGDLLSNQFAEYAENLAALTGNSYNRILHVETSTDGYVDGANLRSGVYVRDGTFKYTSRDGASNTVESYSLICDEDEINRFKAEIIRVRNEEKNRKDAEEKEKMRIEKESGTRWIEDSGVRDLYETEAAKIAPDKKLERVLKVSRMFGIEERSPDELKEFLIGAFHDAKWDRTQRDAFATKAIQMYRKESKKYGEQIATFNKIKSELYWLEQKEN